MIVPELLDQLKPIAEIVGDSAVAAEYSDSQFYRNGTYQAGWKVSVNANYRGAHIAFSNRAPTLQSAADLSLAELRTALGMT
jgi:hypothetical protein